MEAAKRAPILRLTVSAGEANFKREFTGAFRIGRADGCEVCIKNEYVSRQHVEVAFKQGQWWVEDLRSSNGIFLDGNRTERAAVEDNLTIRLGVAGPVLEFAVAKPAPQTEGDGTIVDRYVERYFGKGGGGEVGEHTVFVRRAAAKVQAKQRRKYEWLIVGLVGMLLLGGGYLRQVRRQLVEQKSSAQDLFYTMKSLDLEIGNLQRLVQGSAYRGEGLQQIQKQRSRRVDLERNYNKFLATLKVYDPKMTEKQKLIMRVARIFGECELDMPKNFEAEIDRYIKRWQQTDRLSIGIRKAQRSGYIKPITDELLTQGLPPQFLYLALQESGFEEYASGPETSKGIAKGMWQFIPETAEKYGMRLGPLVDKRRPDPADDRHHYDRETKAAVRYLKDLYCTDAQASGLLVMACYNWGEGRVLPLVREMPDNPKERNFWRLLAKYKDRMPQETYDYVFYIASAAVIGEDPRKFGFDFDNPLAGLEGR